MNSKTRASICSLGAVAAWLAQGWASRSCGTRWVLLCCLLYPKAAPVPPSPCSHRHPTVKPQTPAGRQKSRAHCVGVSSKTRERGTIRENRLHLEESYTSLFFFFPSQWFGTSPAQSHKCESQEWVTQMKHLLCSMRAVPGRGCVTVMPCTSTNDSQINGMGDEEESDLIFRSTDYTSTQSIPCQINVLPRFLPSFSWGSSRTLLLCPFFTPSETLECGRRHQIFILCRKNTKLTEYFPC